MSDQGASSARIAVFDLGGVLVDPTTLNDDLAAVLDVDRDDFRTAYWIRRLEYDLGLPARDYWADVLARLDMSATTEQLAKLVQVDSEGWTTLRPDAHHLLQRLNAGGVQIAVLSNATREMGETARASSWAAYVSDWFFSAELGLAKPNPDLYRYVSDALGVSPADLFYLEDVRRGVEVAETLGWKAHLWTSQGEAEVVLRTEGWLVR